MLYVAADTLHRFCKKEHDWGWKKFMELSKVLDGFTVADTLVIKAQVQVIIDKPSRPFRCLDPQYRRELVRVYLSNVESICRRLCEEKRLRLSWMRAEAPSLRDFWARLPADKQRKLLTEKAEVVLKGLLKTFFNEKEVTSTLVMDALYAGCRQVEEATRQWAAAVSAATACARTCAAGHFLKSGQRAASQRPGHFSPFPVPCLPMHAHSSLRLLPLRCLPPCQGGVASESPIVMLMQDTQHVQLNGDLMDVADKACREYIPPLKDDKVRWQRWRGWQLPRPGCPCRG